MKNNKLTKALIVVSTIGAVASIVRLVLMLIDRKSQHTDEVLYFDEDCDIPTHPDFYDQDEEDCDFYEPAEEDVDNE